MKFLISIVFLCSFSSTFAIGESIKANIATQMFEDGKIDGDRFFIFHFNYLDFGQKVDLICDVISITVTNKNCSQETLGGKGFWLKPEVSNTYYNGSDNFSCKYRKINSDTAELLISESGSDYQITHRLISNTKSRTLIDYKGQLTKTSSITKKIETAEFKPILSKSLSSNGWESVELGCNKLSLPTLTPESKNKK